MAKISKQTDGDIPAPEVNTDKVCFLIAKARELEAEDVSLEPDDSNPTDDRSAYILTGGAYNTISAELTAFINALDEDEKAELVALAWIGRGDYGARELRAAAAEAKSRKEIETSIYLLGIPLLSDYLEAALDEFGMSCDDFESRNSG